MADPSPLATDASSSGPNYGVTPPPKGSTGSTDPAKTGIMTVMNPDQIAAAATSQINSEIQGQVDPLQAQFDTTGAQEERTRQAIESMFGSIEPYVKGAATEVGKSYDAALGAQGSIFSTAMTQLNQLKQQRAQEAQALAQEMGGPVALSEFEGGVNQNQTELANLGAGQMLHTLGYAQAGVQEANAWSGRVFPLIHTEEQAKARTYFEDKKRELQDQITSLRASAAGKIATRKNDLLIQEREFQLKKVDQQLQKVKDSRDWAATLRQLKNDDARLAIAQRQQKLDEANVTGTLDGKPTLEARKLTADEKAQARQLGLDEKTYLLHKQELETTTKVDAQKLASANRSVWAQWLDAGYSGSGKSQNVVQWVPVDESIATGLAGIKHPEQFQKVNGQWYHSVTQTVTSGNAPITDPNKLTDFLLAHNVPKKIAVNMVRHRLSIPKWDYGKPDPRAPKPPKQKSGPPAPGKTTAGPYP